ncbi:outer membrane beta-barrel protein [Termitidicoccus mucosus]
MKLNTFSRILGVAIGMLMTNLLVQGQTGSLAGRDVIGFWEVGPGIMLSSGLKVKQSGGRVIEGDSTFIGGTFSGGALLKGHHKLQLTAGYFYAADDVRASDLPSGEIEQRINFIPVVAEYHYRFAFSETVALRAGALFGVSAISLTYTNTDLDSFPGKKHYEAAVTYGGSVGMDVRLTDNLHLDFGYKYVGTGKTSFRPKGGGSEYRMDSIGGHLLSAALQMRF